ncbi:MAG: hypothetical protein GDA46_01450 [Bdellovibrionales bacterium]|nr:hypothetical protein [Bdellovibrionales bacterium]
MTRDVVFKKFFVDKPEILKRVLIHFLNIPEIMKLKILTSKKLEEKTSKAKPQNKQSLEFLDSNRR